FGLLGVVAARGLDIELEPRVGRHGRLECLHAAAGQARGDRPVRRAVVGAGDDLGIGPQLGLVRVAAFEAAYNSPRLVADRDGVADVEPAELLVRAVADDQLAKARFEPAALDQLDLRADLPGLWPDAAQLRIDVAAVGRAGQADHLRQLRRQQRPAVAALG